MLNNSIPWIEKYRPKKIREMVQNPNLIELFENIMKTGNIPHMLFYGPPGTGKTSSILAMGRELFGEHYPTRIIEFNASDDRGINAVRDKITYEAKKYVPEITNLDGKIVPAYKIIILDEADSMTDEAQDALRVIIEQYSTVTRFCFICNYISKITDAVKSRCSKIYFKRLTDECMITKMKEIAIHESMDLSIDILKTIADISGGDMRKSIMILQNVKYLNNFKKSQSKKFEDFTYLEFKNFCPFVDDSNTNQNITIKDIYNMAATIDNETADLIVQEITVCTTIIEISNLNKKIISMGYPVDNIILQLNNSIIRSNFLTNIQKAKIIKHTTSILYKMKECANEYIQLLDYLSCVYSVNKNTKFYD